MENPQTKWRFLAGKIIYKWTIFQFAMLNNQRISINYNIDQVITGITIKYNYNCNLFFLAESFNVTS